jgi:hypothetical protein
MALPSSAVAMMVVFVARHPTRLVLDNLLKAIADPLPSQPMRFSAFGLVPPSRRADGIFD